MKKNILILAVLAFCGSVSLQAAPVSSDRALEIAKAVFSVQSGAKTGSGELSIIWDGESAANKGTQPAIWVIGRDGGGWVIVSGDDNARPVLGISPDGNFSSEEMPGNVLEWMERIKAFVRSSNVQTAEVRDMWAGYTATKSTVLSGVTDEFTASRTVEWNQSGAANLYSPQVGRQHTSSVCGCLPLAMAEIMTWYGYPKQGTGTLESYTYTTGDNQSQTISGHELKTKYLWSDLKAVRTGSDFTSLNPTSDVYKNLGQLTYDCGVMLKAKFNNSQYGGTGASDSEVVKAFGDHMGYNKAAHIELADNYPAVQWVSMLLAQVAQHPVLYCGYAPSSTGNDAGHAYVFDGYAKYNGDDVFHVNFGWGGTCNGYYYADSQYARYGSSINYNFNTELRALFDFVPDENGSSQYSNKLCLYNWTFQGYPEFIGLNTDATAISAGTEFTWRLGAIYNIGAIDFTGVVKIVLEGYDGREKRVIDEADFSEGSLGVNYLTAFWDDITLDEIAFGDRIVAYYTTDTANSQWERLCAYVYDGTIVDELPLVPLPFIRTESSYAVGDVFEFRPLNYDKQFTDAVWKITDPDGVTQTKNQSELGFALTKAGKYKIELTLSGVSEKIVTHILVR